MNKKLKSEFIKSILFLLLGLALVGYGYFFTTDNKYVTTVGASFAMIGFIQSILYYSNRNNPKWNKNLALENEERNVFIRGKSSSQSFWTVFFFVLITCNLNFFRSMSITNYGIVIICFMSVVYFTYLTLNYKKN